MRTSAPTPTMYTEEAAAAASNAGVNGSKPSAAAAAASSPFPTGVSRWDRAAIAALGPGELAAVRGAIDHLALLSAKSQRLKTPLSTVGRLLASEYVLYVLADEQGRALGFIKLGRKCLYVTNPGGMMIQVKPVCVLDFYVHESLQRRGLGARLLTLACQEEGLGGPSELAFDRPSPQLKPFLAKHFGMNNFTPQHNHFVLFDAFFAQHEARLLEERRRRQQQQYQQHQQQPLPPLLLPGMDHPHPTTTAASSSSSSSSSQQPQQRRHTPFRYHHHSHHQQAAAAGVRPSSSVERPLGAF